MSPTLKATRPGELIKAVFVLYRRRSLSPAIRRFPRIRIQVPQCPTSHVGCAVFLPRLYPRCSQTGDADCGNKYFFLDESGWVMRCRPVPGIPDVPWDGRVLRVSESWRVDQCYVLDWLSAYLGLMTTNMTMANMARIPIHFRTSMTHLHPGYRRRLVKTEVVLSLSSSSPPQLVRHCCYDGIDDFTYLS